MSNGSVTETLADPTTLTMPVTDDTVNDYLNNKKVSVILQPSSNASDNVLTVDSGLSVPSGKSLTAGTGISTNVQSGQTLQVDGHMEMEGSLTNAGTVNNTSANTLQIGGDLDNAGTLDNSTGRLIVLGRFLNGGTLTSGNIIENSSAVENTGTFVVNGGTVGTVNLNNGGTLNVNSGTISDVIENGGTLQLNSGTIGNLTISSKEIDISRGTVENVKINGGGLIVDGGTTNEVNMPGNGKIILKRGNGGNLTVVQGTVEVRSGATLEYVDIQGGIFELNGGTVLNGLTQTGENASVHLKSGTVKAGDSIAVNIQKGTAEIELGEQDNGQKVLEVSADSPQNLVMIGDEAKVQVTYSEKLAEQSYTKEAVVVCQPEEQMTSLEEMNGPYRLTDFSDSLVDELQKDTSNLTIYVILTNKIIGSESSEENQTIQYNIGVGKKCCIELNGHTLTLNAQLNVGVGKQSSQSLDENTNGVVAVLSKDDGIAIQNEINETNENTWLTIMDEKGTGELVLNNHIEIVNDTVVVFLKNLNVSRNPTAQFGNYGPKIDHVTVKDQPVIEGMGSPTPFIEGCIQQDIDNLVYKDMSGVFQKSLWREKTCFTLNASTLTTQGSTIPIFDFSTYSDSDSATVEIKYGRNVLLSNDKGGRVFKLGTGSNLEQWPEKFNRILPKTCSTNEDGGIVIRSKGNEFLNVTNEALKTKGYSYSEKDGYFYLVKDDQTALLNLNLATPTNAIAIKDIPLATPHNATKSDADKMEYGKATPGNAEERKEYGKASSSNADEAESTDEEYDEPDYDDEEDEPDEIPLVNDLILIPEESIELKTTQFSNREEGLS